MLKKLLVTLVMLSAALMAHAAKQPTISDGTNVVWYIVQFLNGSTVLEAQGDGEQVKTASLRGTDNQLWKIEGSASVGYTFTSKSGLKLHTTTTARDGMFKASTNPTSNYLFTWTNTTNATYSDGFVISPKANQNVFMNQWQGAGVGKYLGLWDDKASGDQPLQFLSAEEALTTDQRLPLIPYPLSLTEGEGKLSASTLTGINYVDEPTKRYVEEFAAQLKLTSGLSLPVSTSAPAKGISLTVDKSLDHEGYTLTIDGNGVAITSADSTGFFYAIQTIKQLLPGAIYGKEKNTAVAWELPYVTINDKPRFGHRGFMLDIARHYFSPYAVKRVLDVMASYKLNMLHWHLTDDQGWRIEIPEYPKLVEVGSIRKASFTNEGTSPKFYDDTEYGRGMWYSLDDLREIVKYAKDRNIEILPEIDLPGHMVAAITAYPELSCDPSKTYEVRVNGGISHDVLNVGKDEVIDFLKCVLGHVADVFPYPYIHIGGDECPTENWASNAECLQRVKDEGLGGVNELQSWLANELGKYLRDEKQKGIVVWDEVLKNWNTDNEIKPLVMAWNMGNQSLKAAQYGLKSIRAPYTEVYLDFMQMPADQCDVNEGYQGGWGVNTLEEVYGLNPLNEVLNTQYEDMILGVQGNMWTETCSDTLQLEYQMFPRLLGVAEIGWLPNDKKSWIGFYTRLQSHDEVLDLRGYNYAKHYILNDDTAEEAALKEAKEILDASYPDTPGYPTKAEYDKLEAARSALAAAAGDADKLTALTAAIAAYKQAEVCQPKEGKTYELISASTYYRAKYAGSTAYVKNAANIAIHYTPQTEPEELWQFIKTDKGYKMENVFRGTQVTYPSANGQDVSLTKAGTDLLVQKATVPSAQYDYVPGALNLTAVDGATGDAARHLFAHASGVLQANADNSLCKAGTWYLREVNDFTAQLQGLVKKCQWLILVATPGEIGQPSAEAVKFLAEQLITPASAVVEQGGVTEEVYNEYVSIYKQYLNYEKASISSQISEEYYYRIRNAYPDFNSYLAAVNTSNNEVTPKTSSMDDNFLWRFEKNDDGTVKIFNKATGTGAYVASDKDDAKIFVGKDYSWGLEAVTTDQNVSGIAIVTPSETRGWYINPNAWQYIQLKPKTWGGSIWSFEKLNVAVGIADVINAPKETRYYDLQGRRVLRPVKGVFVTGDGRKVIF